MKKIIFLALFCFTSCSKEDIIEQVLEETLEDSNYCNQQGFNASDCVTIQLECPNGGFEYGEPDSGVFCSCSCPET